uniref:DNA 5'-3' helicase n=1 Tax=Sarcopeltis skottsbergii TaxID=2765380 RepID=A0A7M1VHZ0_SARSK|nr:replicative DNA helicase subunit [Sarcopeltis skottsbergii]
MHNLQQNFLPPQNYIAEEILLGSLIVKPELFDLIFQSLKIECFFLESHRIIYRNLITIHKKKEINAINLIYSLKNGQMLQIIGGIKKIITIIKQSQIITYSMHSNFYINEIIKIIYENYIKRLIIQYGYNVVLLTHNKKISNKQLFFKLSQYINYIEDKANFKNIDNLPRLIGDLISSIQYKNYNLIHLNHNIYSGFEELDQLINGLTNGDLIVIAGRPSMGKTSFVINIAYNILQKTEARLCIFTLEMNKMQILHKLISIGSMIPVNDILYGNININEWRLIQYICDNLIKARIYINDLASISIDEIIYISKFIIKGKDYKSIIIIDYLQLIQAKNIKIESRAQELSYITRQLKILAQNLNVPVIILSQLNRNIETRVNKKPILSDLKESGCIGYKMFNHMDKRNQLNIKNFIKYKNVIYLTNIEFRSSIMKNFDKNNNNYTDRIYSFNQYTFNCYTCSKYKLCITSNHKIFNYKNWFTQNQISKEDSILSYVYTLYNKLQVTKNFLTMIKFNQYSLVYDLKRKHYTNYISNNIILHNSIEQDADIVIMLYCNISNTEIQINSKILDVTITKNRNGSIGCFQLLFHPQNTSFSNIKNIK